MTKSYEALTMGQYVRINALLEAVKAGGMEEVDMQVEVIGILSGRTETEVLAMSLEDYAAAVQESAFLTRPLGDLPQVRKTYAAGPFTLEPVKDYKHLTAGQYIDFQAYTAKGVDYLGLLSVLLVPKGFRYGEGYDPAEVREAVAALPMPEGMALIAFFLRQFVLLMRSSLTSSTAAVRRMPKGSSRRTELEARIAAAQRLLQAVGVG